MITVFVRRNRRARSEPCDRATVPVRKAKGKRVRYFGACAGVHAPGVALESAVLADDADPWAWLASRGYVRAEVFTANG